LVIDYNSGKPRVNGVVIFSLKFFTAGFSRCFLIGKRAGIDIKSGKPLFFSSPDCDYIAAYCGNDSIAKVFTSAHYR
jgi:hypothetical protein